MASRSSVLGIVAIGLASCGPPPPHSMTDAHVVLGPPTGSTCPTTPVTWTDFGQSFFESYCTRCHSVGVTGADRNGAPVDHDYDTAAGVRMWITEIDQVAAAGPGATNEQMPFLGSQPSLAERQQLGQLLACGVPD